MFKFPVLKFKINRSKIIVSLFFLLVLAITAYILILQYKNSSSEKSNINSMILAKEKVIESLENQIKSVNDEYTKSQSTDGVKKATELQAQLDLINKAFNDYSALQKSIEEVKSKGGNVDDFNKQYSDIANMLLSQKYSDAQSAEDSLNTSITNALIDLNKPAPTSTPTHYTPPTSSNLPGSSLTRTSVSVNGKSFSVYYITIDLGSSGLKIITDTAQTTDCSNNCTVNDLMTYYNRNHGFAAINGTYFCPTAYPTCAGKTNSFGYSVYNTPNKKWINQPAIPWVGGAMLTFSGTTPHFYPTASSYKGALITAGFIMAPGLVNNGQVIVDNYPLDAKSKYVYTTRGAMGIKGNSVIIADVMGATVPESAYVMQNLGVTSALELDGGGSVAMIYNGSYVLGPGRNIPNAIIFARN